jgi:cytochrome c oxidase assembly factor CtaG
MTPLSWPTFWTTWAFSPVADPLVLVAAALYGWAVTRTSGWPVRRTLCFAAALVALVIALDSSVDAYSHMLFSMHMAQHLLLIMVVPALVVLGHPLELLRRATSARFTVPAPPALGLAGYTVVLVGTHLTPFMQVMLEHPWVHGVEQVLYLVSGYLLLLPLVGDEPVRRKVSHLLRLLVLFVAMVVDAVVGVVLMMTASEPFPGYLAQHRTWGPDPLTDLHWGGVAMWVGGDGLMMLIGILIIGQWIADAGHNDTGPWLDAARRKALADAGVDLDEAQDLDSDAALEAYNAMLARMAMPRPRVPEDEREDR